MLAFIVFAIQCVDPPQPLYPVPDEAQLRFHREELSAFIHFNMNTFTDVEWGNGSEKEEWFAPTGLDTDQWIQTLKAANFKRVLLTVKHHDGFCIYNTKYTKHQVNMSTKWVETAKKIGKSIDILEELSKSATKYDMNVGLYHSLWDMNSPYYGQGEPYDTYYLNQLQEILGNKKYGNNGKFVEVWMDGAHDPAKTFQNYHFLKYFDLIWKLHPGITIFSVYGSTSRWSGKEHGQIGYPTWAKINQMRMRNYYDKYNTTDSDYLWAGDPNGDIWTNIESGLSVSPGWYWHEKESPMSIQKLSNYYFNIVGVGQPFLMNVPPSVRGRFEDKFVKIVLELGECINKTFNLNLAQLPGVTAKASSTRGNDSKFAASNVLDQDTSKYWTMDDGELQGTLEIDLGLPFVFDVIQISEHIELGQRVKNFTVEVSNRDKWTLIGKYSTIGAKRLIRTKPFTADKIRFTITDSLAVPVIESVGAFKAYGGFVLPSRLDSVRNFINDNSNALMIIACVGGICIFGCIIVALFILKRPKEQVLTNEEVIDYTEFKQ